jgi:hypothetical protein
MVRLQATVRDMATSIAKLEIQMSPMWQRLQSQFSSDLHHPEPRYAEMDALLEKLEALTITNGERLRLRYLLLQRSTDTDVTEEQRTKAAMMIQIMKMVLIEKEK